MSKRIGIWPFYSQQDKRTGAFQLETCGATKQMVFVEKCVRNDLGWATRVAVPRHVTSGFHRPVQVDVPSSNPVQKVHWDTQAIRAFFSGCDIALLNHETLAVPVRALFPDIAIAQMCAVDPRNGTRLLSAAWLDADVVVAQTKTAASFMRPFCTGRVDVWPMTYEASNIRPSADRKSIDVLFVQRCSATNYTRHCEFVAQDWGDLRVRYVDVTGYLRKQFPHTLDYSVPGTYYQDLSRSKVAVALNDDMFGGQAIREAIVSGCVPVVLDCPCYRELVGMSWPYAVRQDLSNLRDIVLAAVHGECDMSVPLANAREQSYHRAWPAVKETLCTISS